LAKAAWPPLAKATDRAVARHKIAKWPMQRKVMPVLPVLSDSDVEVDMHHEPLDPQKYIRFRLGGGGETSVAK
jgi:hypothetical protein